MFRQIRSKLLAAFAVPLAILVAVAGLAISSTLSQTRTAQGRTRGRRPRGAVGLAARSARLALGHSRQPGGIQRRWSTWPTRPNIWPPCPCPPRFRPSSTPTPPAASYRSCQRSGWATSKRWPAWPPPSKHSTRPRSSWPPGQAALRRNLSDAFVNLGRRNQNLVTRQLEYITEIELKEADPTSLEELFRLDHLATRMRRNAESLLILAGSGPARQWSASVPA